MPNTSNHESDPPFTFYSRSKLVVLLDHLKIAEEALQGGYEFMIGYRQALWTETQLQFLDSNRGDFSRANTRLEPAMKDILMAINSKDRFLWDAHHLRCTEHVEAQFLDESRNFTKHGSEEAFRRHYIEPLAQLSEEWMSWIGSLRQRVHERLVDTSAIDLGDCRIHVHMKNEVISLDGEPFNANAQQCIFVQALIDASKDAFVSGKDIAISNDLFDESKVTRTKDGLPKQIYQLIDSKRGLGSRLRPEAWRTK